MGLFALFFILAVINPLFHHRGDTVLFYMRGNAITLEAVWFGLYMSAMIMIMLLWCERLTEYMTMDKVTALLATAMPRTALVFCMILRFVPMYLRKYREFLEVQKLLGIMGDGSWIEKTAGYLRAFSAMITWALEHSMETADSMRSRYYGNGKRSNFKQYGIKITDVIIMIYLLLSSVYIVYVMQQGHLACSFYPVFRQSDIGFREVLALLLFGGGILILPVSGMIHTGKKQRAVKYLSVKG